MKSKASYFSISQPLIIENLKRMWPISVIGFLVYFFSGAFPIIMSYKTLNNMASYIEWSLHNLQPFYMGVHLVLPVIAAVALFGYLQSSGSVAVMHSMPFTRPKLFNSNYLSGLILIGLPILVNGIILLLLSKPTFQQWGPPTDRGISDIDVFTRMEVLNWIGVSLLIVVVLYSISVFSGIVTGNSVMHFLTSYYFIFLIPLLYTVFNVYFQEFLFGFDISGSWIERALSISPYTGVLSGGGYFELWEVLFYLFTIVVMTGAGAVLYTRRKLEKATDSLVFEFVKPIISYVIAFLGMTMLGFYFYLLGDSRTYMYAGFVAGTLIFFIIGSMVVEKSPRIYNRQGYRNFLIYSLIAILFVVGLNFDLTGFEKRVPKVDRIKGAEFSIPFDDFSYGWVDSAHRLESKENIEALTAFHQSIIKDRKDTKKSFLGGEDTSIGIDDGWTKASAFRLKYKTNSRFSMSRRYRVDYDSYKDDPNLKKIFESAEYKLAGLFASKNIEKYDHVLIHPESWDMYYEDEEREKVITDQAEIEELVKLLDKDYKAMTYEDLVSLKPFHLNMEIAYTAKGEASGNLKGGNTRYYFLQILPSFTNTIEWLRDKGYYKEITVDDVAWIDIYPPREEWITFEKTAMSSAGGVGALMTITDEARIQKVLDNYEREATSRTSSYEVYIAFTDDRGATIGYLNKGLDFL